MRKLILLVAVVLLVLVPMCDSLQNECVDDSDCNDGNPCTNDDCQYYWTGDWNPERSCWSDSATYFRCQYSEVDDGTPCDVGGEPGVCEAGECQPEGKTSEPVGDAGML